MSGSMPDSPTHAETGGFFDSYHLDLSSGPWNPQIDRHQRESGARRASRQANA